MPRSAPTLEKYSCGNTAMSSWGDSFKTSHHADNITGYSEAEIYVLR